MLANDTGTETEVTFTCHITGTDLQDMNLQIKRNGRVLSEEDGLVSSGLQTNEDNTYQRTDSVKTLRSDLSKHTCEVTQEATPVNMAQSKKRIYSLILLPAGGCWSRYNYTAGVVLYRRNHHWSRTGTCT